MLGKRRPQGAPPAASGRILYWWHVPERPGVGRDMLLITVGWFASLFVLAILIGTFAPAG